MQEQGADAISPEVRHREQRTALTTARSRTEEKRTHLEVHLLLQDTPDQSSGMAIRDLSRRDIHNSSVECLELNPASLLSNVLNNQCLIRTRPGRSGNSENFYDENRIRRHRRNYIPKFVGFFACAYLVATMQVSSAAPSRKVGSDFPFQESPKWTNPCGVEPNNDADDQVTASTTIASWEDFDTIHRGAFYAEANVQSVLDEYLDEKFKSTKKDAKNIWNGKIYPWLPEFNNMELDGNVSEEHLKQIQDSLDTSLPRIYEDLQKIAVGLEQVVYDSRQTEPKYHKMFEEANRNLLYVLCDINIAMSHLKYERRPNVERSVMDNDDREISSTAHRRIRDWIIFKQFLIGMKYVKEVTKHMKDVLAN